MPTLSVVEISVPIGFEFFQTIFFLLLEFIFFMENTLLMSCFAQSGPAALVAFLFSPPPGHKAQPTKALENEIL